MGLSGGSRRPLAKHSPCRIEIRRRGKDRARTPRTRASVFCHGVAFATQGTTRPGPSPEPRPPSLGRLRWAAFVGPPLLGRLTWAALLGPPYLGRLTWAALLGPPYLGRLTWAAFVGPPLLGRLCWAAFVGPPYLGRLTWAALLGPPYLGCVATALRIKSSRDPAPDGGGALFEATAAPAVSDRGICDLAGVPRWAG